MAKTASAEQSRSRDSVFEVLYEEHHRAVLAYCFRRASWADAWDAPSEVFVVAWRRLDDVPLGDTSLPWLYAVAHKVLANQRRSERRRRALTGRAALANVDDYPAPEVQLVRKEEAAEVVDALTRLRARDREVIQLALWEQLRPVEIGVVLGISRAAVDQRLTRAKQRLAKELKRQHAWWDVRSKPHRERRV